MEKNQQFSGLGQNSDATVNNKYLGQQGADNDQFNSSYNTEQTLSDDVDEINLNDDVPDLQAGRKAGLNKKGLIFLILVGAFGLATAAWALKNFLSGPEVQEEKSEEVVTIPEPPMPSAPIAPADSVALSGTPPVSLNNDVKPIPDAPELEPLPPSSPTPPMTIASTGSLNSPVVSGNSIYDRRKEGGMIVGVEDVAAGQDSSGSDDSEVERGSARRLRGGVDNILVRGAYIRCIMGGKIHSNIPSGLISCLVTEPVYSFSGKKLLVPKGSKVTGEYNYSPKFGDRVSIIWDRILTPTGVDFTLKSPGVDGMGATGVRGNYKTHWGANLASALMISLIGDGFKYAGEKYGPAKATTNGSIIAVTPFDSESAKMLNEAAKKANEDAYRSPAVEVRQGELVNIYVARDIDFSSVVE